MSQFNFDASTVEPAQDFSVLAPGKYVAVATQTEVKPNKKATGSYLQIVWEIIDGVGKGRKIFDRLNIQNENKQAEEIAQRALSSLCRSLGVMKLTDTSELENIPVMLDVKIEPAKGEYAASNSVKGYSPASGEALPAQVTSPVTKAAAPAAASTKPAWKR